jgi:hypothetical protein
MNYSAKNVFIESHGLLSGLDIILYSINQSLKLYCIQIQMGGTYTMVQLAGGGTYTMVQLAGGGTYTMVQLAGPNGVL